MGFLMPPHFLTNFEIKKIKNIKANTFRVQANNSIMCGYFCIGFIDFILAGKTLRIFFLLMTYKIDDIILI